MAHEDLSGSLWGHESLCVVDKIYNRHIHGSPGWFQVKIPDFPTGNLSRVVLPPKCTVLRYSWITHRCACVAILALLYSVMILPSISVTQNLTFSSFLRGTRVDELLGPQDQSHKANSRRMDGKTTRQKTCTVQGCWKWWDTVTEGYCNTRCSRRIQV